MRHRKRRLTPEHNALTEALRSAIVLCLCDARGVCQCIRLGSTTPDVASESPLPPDLTKGVNSPAGLTPFQG